MSSRVKSKFLCSRKVLIRQNLSQKLSSWKMLVPDGWAVRLPALTHTQEASESKFLSHEQKHMNHITLYKSKFTSGWQIPRNMHDHIFIWLHLNRARILKPTVTQIVYINIYTSNSNAKISNIKYTSANYKVELDQYTVWKWGSVASKIII